MTTLIYDDEPKWLSHFPDCPHATNLPDALALIKAGGITEAIVSNRKMKDIPALLETGIMVKVATGQSSTREEIKAYRAGAVDYFIKDFRR